MSAERPSVRNLDEFHRRVGGLAALAVTFFLAAFPARNSDAFHHLAVGRLIQTGHTPDGRDPLSAASDSAYWVNHSWFVDRLAYPIHQRFGDRSLVLVKAVLVVAGAWILLVFAGGRVRPGLAVMVVISAMLAASGRLLLQPATLSFFLLIATGAILCTENRRWKWLLPAIGAFWVNVDAWFVSGIAAVVAYFVLERVVGRKTVPPAVLVGMLISWLLNPHHYHAMQWPWELNPAILTGPLPSDPNWRGLFLSPWSFSRLIDWDRSGTAAGWAFPILVVASALSFIGASNSGRVPRAGLWLLALAVASINVRMVPFFAAVSAVTTLANFRDRFAASRDYGPFRRIGSAMLQTAFMGAAIVFVRGGWAHGYPNESRRFGLELVEDAGYRRSAIDRRTDGRDAVNTFYLNPDSAHYAQWLRPEERTTMDLRIAKFHSATDHFAVVSAMVDPELTADRFRSTVEPILRRMNVDRLVIAHPDPQRISALLGVLWFESDWSIVSMVGRDVVFERRTGPPVRIDPDGDAWTKGNGEAAAVTGWADPDRGRADWWNVAEWSAPRTPNRGGNSPFWQVYVDVSVRRRPIEAYRERTAFHVAGTVAALGACSSPGHLAMTVMERVSRDPRLLPAVDSVSPSAAYAAIRSARQTIVDSPGDYAGYFQLGRAYIALTEATREGEWAGQCRALAQLRHIQTVAALERAVELAPDVDAVRELLVRTYMRRGMPEPALAHLKEQVRIRSRGPVIKGDGSLATVQARVKELESYVQERRGEFRLRSQGLAADPRSAAETALSLGLHLTAVDEVFLKSDIVLFGVDGARLQLESLLMLGRVRRVERELQLPELASDPDRLGVVELPGGPIVGRYRMPAYDWFRLLAASARGDNVSAVSAGDEILRKMSTAREARLNRATIGQVVLASLDVGLGSTPETRWAFAWNAGSRFGLTIEQAVERSARIIEADIGTVIDLQRLEYADPRQVRERLRAREALGDSSYPLADLNRAYQQRLSRLP